MRTLLSLIHNTTGYDTTIHNAMLIARGLLLTVLIALPQALHAQDAETIFNAYFKNWYQVELIVFERIEAADIDPEAWPKNLQLRYPTRVEFLKQDTPTGETSSEPVHHQDNEQLLTMLRKGNPDDAFNKKLIETLSAAELQRLTPKEKPYTLLNESLRNLNSEARLLGRDRSMRLLTHAAWRQPFYDKKEAPALLITGGDPFDQHHELEGSILLHLGRYLHIETDLWLTRFEANTGLSDEHWPWLPTRPKPVDFSRELNAAEATEDENLLVDTTLPSLEFGFADELNLDNNKEDSALFSDFADLATRPFIVKHLVAMRQARRMRSGELHYLDHPKLGILLRIDPYAPKFSR